MPHISISGRVIRYLIRRHGSAYQISKDLQLRYHSVFDALKFLEREGVVEPIAGEHPRSRRDYKLATWVEEANAQWVNKITYLRHLADWVTENKTFPQSKKLNALAALLVSFLDESLSETLDLIDLELRLQSRQDFPTHERMQTFTQAYENILSAFFFFNKVTHDEFIQLRSAAPILLSIDHGGAPIKRLSSERAKQARKNKDIALLYELEGYDAWHQRLGWYSDLQYRMKESWEYYASPDPLPSEEFAHLAVERREAGLEEIGTRLRQP